MCKDIFLDKTSKTTYNHLAYMFLFTFIVNIHISKYKKSYLCNVSSLSEKEASQRYVFYLLEHLLKINIFDPNSLPHRTHSYPVPCSGVQRLLYIQHHL